MAWYSGLKQVYEDVTGQTAAKESKQAKRDRERARAAWEIQQQRADAGYDDALDQWNDVLPEEYVDEEYVEGTAQTAGAASAGADPRSVDAQMRALAAMEEVYGQGGLTAVDRARIAQAQAGTRTFERGQRDALAQEAEARGMGAGGARFAGEIGAQQEGANRLSQMGLDIEGMAQERAFNAMQAAGGLGSQARGQSFGEDLARREAQDAANRFNTEYSRDRAERAGSYGRDRSQRATEREERRRGHMADTGWDYVNASERATAGTTGQYNQNATAAQAAADKATGVQQGAYGLASDFFSDDDE